jgi:hypothetical protein
MELARKPLIERLNAWTLGQFGAWDSHVCQNPQLLDREMSYLANKEA